MLARLAVGVARSWCSWPRWAYHRQAGRGPDDAGPDAAGRRPRAAWPGFANDVFAAEDFFSRIGGMTQSETSNAWCGSNAVIGFNDSGSFIATAFLAQTPSGSLSLNGWSQSTNAGGSWTDLGPLLRPHPAGGGVFRDLLGDPVIGCTSQGQLLLRLAGHGHRPGDAFAFTRDLGVQLDRRRHHLRHAEYRRGQDANPTPGQAVARGRARADVRRRPTTSCTSPTPTSTSAGSGAGPAGRASDRHRVRALHRRRPDLERAPGDGGAPRHQGFLHGSQVEPGVGTTSMWRERYPFDPTLQREIAIRRSTDLGATFAPAVAVTPVTPMGDSGLLQGGFRDFLDLQGLAVDRPTDRVAAPSTSRSRTDRPVRRSTRWGSASATPCTAPGRPPDQVDQRRATWSAPGRINNDDVNLGIDQFMPHVDVDRSGNVWAVLRPRRDERNFMIDTSVARSTNGGATWTNTRATKDQFPPITGWQDLIINPAYMGDYIAVAADSTGRYPGVITCLGRQRAGRRERRAA